MSSYATLFSQSVVSMHRQLASCRLFILYEVKELSHVVNDSFQINNTAVTIPSLLLCEKVKQLHTVKGMVLVYFAIWLRMVEHWYHNERSWTVKEHTGHPPDCCRECAEAMVKQGFISTIVLPILKVKRTTIAFIRPLSLSLPIPPTS
jgi:hypothetical protein